MIYENGYGYLAYLELFKQGKVSTNNQISLIGEDLAFFVNDDGSLDWADVHTKKTLLEREINYDLKKIPPKEVLSRKRWYVSYRENN